MPIATDRISDERPGAPHFTATHKQRLRRKLFAWYARNARDLPWRRSRDPYRVWISEVMLQQTQVATVRDYFTRFINALPTVQSLAAADEQQVLRLWEGLGYYRRARQLHAAAKKVVAELEGEFPRSVEELRQLPGIGRYTAGAIASIAFDQRAPILEANTVRLFSRLIAYRSDPLSTAGQRVLWQAAEDILPQKNIAQFNQALMELGSLVCTPSEPKCNDCPLTGVCAAFTAGLQTEIPRPKQKRQYTKVREAAICVRRNGRVLMRQCGANERWAGLWDFPRFEIDAEGPLFAQKEIATKLRKQTGIACGDPTLITSIRHGVTRYRITLDFFQAPYVAGRIPSTDQQGIRWVPTAELPDLPLSTTGRKLAQQIGASTTQTRFVSRGG